MNFYSVNKKHGTGTAQAQAGTSSRTKPSRSPPSPLVTAPHGKTFSLNLFDRTLLQERDDIEPLDVNRAVLFEVDHARFRLHLPAVVHASNLDEQVLRRYLVLEGRKTSDFQRRETSREAGWHSRTEVRSMSTSEEYLATSLL